jgi:hypothetical protein
MSAVVSAQPLGNFTASETSAFYAARVPDLVQRGAEWRSGCPGHGGSDNNAAEHAAAIYGVIGSAEPGGIGPETYLRYVRGANQTGQPPPNGFLDSVRMDRLSHKNSPRGLARQGRGVRNWLPGSRACSG